jgi:hypothetical protein
MSTELSTPSTQSNASPPRNDDFSSLHMAIVLRDVAQRLSSVEEKLDSRDPGSRRGARLLEFSKVIFSGWPAFAFLFILLFYSPLKQALNAIPEKVKAADEIGVLGVSLKSTIKVEAAKLGETRLSETIPTLSSGAIELFLRAPRNSDSLISYTRNMENRLTEVHFPSPSRIAALSELQGHGLVTIETWKPRGESHTVSGSAITELIEEFRRTHPGTDKSSFSDENATWSLNTQLLSSEEIPSLTWELTDLGKKGVEVILKAVSTELAPKADPGPSKK